MIDFLGNVNVFRGRVNQGQDANVYVRPSDISIDRTPTGKSSMEATVTRINRAGVHAKISLELRNKEEIRVDITMEQLMELHLQLGDSVFAHPNKARVFVPDYTI